MSSLGRYHLFLDTFRLQTGVAQGYISFDDRTSPRIRYWGGTKPSRTLPAQSCCCAFGVRSHSVDRWHILRVQPDR